MDKKNVEVKLLPEGISELIIREGAAPDNVRPNKSIGLAGTIQAPMDYYDLRSKVAGWDDQKAVITVNQDALTIEMDYDLANPLTNDSVKGQLKVNPELTRFCVNSDKNYTQNELVQLLKASKHLFKDRRQCNDLIKALTNFTAKVEHTIEQVRKNPDIKGQTKLMQDSIAKIDVPPDFTLNMPVFIGESKEVFNVSLGYEPAGSSVSFFLESDQLYDVIQNSKDSIFADQLARIPESVLKIYK